QASSYDPLMSAISNAQVVCIGDSSHGTYDFYAHRANLIKRLVEEKSFTAIAVEADWPDAFRINRYVHGAPHIPSARAALSDFERFPKWMWKNEVMPPFIEHLRAHNARVDDPARRMSFYGMDLYSLHRSADEVIRYLERVDPKGAKKARKIEEMTEALDKYNCFERFGEDMTRYAYETQFGLAKDCHKEVIANLKALLANHRRYIEELGVGAHAHPAEEQFVAEMNAIVVRDAEEYYRTMLTDDTKSWNLRCAPTPHHFARTLVKIAEHLGAGGAQAKTVVWAHNSHIGDARATDMGRRRDEVNVRQRCREIFGEHNVFNIGFLTNRGTVLSASYDWDDPPYLQAMNAPTRSSIECVFDEWGKSDCFVVTHRVEDTPEGKREVTPELSDFLDRPRHQHFIGVIYRRDTEVPSHYSRCNVAAQYDAVAHIQESRGVRPLELEDTWKGLTGEEVDLTFPLASKSSES
ncbi:erythromycin esterase, partial [Wolfiporia cocos MD-104 SS10]